jgi:histidyl-tRNA synthetase
VSEDAAKKEERRKFQAVRGTRDLLPPETALWNRVEQTAHEVFSTFGFGEIRLPVIETLGLFARSLGTETDIVGKEMFLLAEREPSVVVHPGRFGPPPQSEQERRDEVKRVFNEPSIRESIEHQIEESVLALRPEATASVCRAYIEHGMQQLPQPVKLYYLGPMFRRERPQKGRYRQFYQIGAEVLGTSDSPRIDAELIEMLMRFFERVGLKGPTLYINSIGDAQCRPKYIEQLRDELLKVKDKLGSDSQRRIETNPLRVLDSKLESEQEVIESLPRISQYLCPDCAKNYEEIKRELQARGITYKENWRLVRGLDYYVRTTFEVTAPGLGSQNAVCGGGRYDGLVELIGGPKFKNTKATGFAIGEDRLILALQHLGAETEKRIDVLVAWKDEQSRLHAQSVARLIRDAGLIVEVPLKPMSPGEGLGLASKLNVPVGIVIGPGEVSASTVSLRLLADRDQVSLAEDKLARTEMRRLLKFRVLLERELVQWAILSGVTHKDVPILVLTGQLVKEGHLGGHLKMPIEMAVNTFNELVHGKDVRQEHISEAIAASVMVLDELSTPHGRTRISVGR